MRTVKPTGNPVVEVRYIFKINKRAISYDFTENRQYVGQSMCRSLPHFSYWLRRKHQLRSIVKNPKTRYASPFTDIGS